MMKRTGSIKRPANTTEPIIRLVGNSEACRVADSEETLEGPDTPAGWDEILHGMFAECYDTPLRKAGGELIIED